MTTLCILVNWWQFEKCGKLRSSLSFQKDDLKGIKKVRHHQIYLSNDNQGQIICLITFLPFLSKEGFRRWFWQLQGIRWRLLVGYWWFASCIGCSDQSNKWYFSPNLRHFRWQRIQVDKDMHRSLRSTTRPDHSSDLSISTNRLEWIPDRWFRSLYRYQRFFIRVGNLLENRSITGQQKNLSVNLDFAVKKRAYATFLVLHFFEKPTTLIFMTTFYAKLLHH